MTNQTCLKGLALVQGTAQAAILASTVPLSFWGGVDPQSGLIIDQHHPLHGSSLTGKIVVIPGGRGSCSGSGVLLEMLLNGNGPAALIFEQEEHILLLGVIIAHEVFEKSIPVLQLSSEDFANLSKASWAKIDGGRIDVLTEISTTKFSASESVEFDISNILADFELSEFDLALLSGSHGKAAQVASRVVLRMGVVQGASSLIDVSQAHIDGCVYTGNACLLFAEQLCEWGAQVRIPSTMNSIGVDQRRWRAQGMDPALGVPASQLADAYVKMGCKPTFTCAPYLLDTAPVRGEQIVWAESNAVVYANSVLGARTMKYPDFMDICIALTGRAPNAGCHISENRLAKLVVKLELSEGDHSLTQTSIDDSLFPLLGYLIGDIAGHRIPLVEGIPDVCSVVTEDDLKAFGAAFATTSSASMFHLAGITPEASKIEELALHMTASTSTISVTRDDLFTVWKELNSSQSLQVDLISLGNPHFSYAEFVKLAQLCHKKTKHQATVMIVTCGREVYSKAYNEGILDVLEEFGVQIVTDTCWCMIVEPVIPSQATCIMTNSAKYAHYGPGLTGRKMRFGSLADCVGAACSGQISIMPPAWITSRLQN